jgi:hypothetical protein
MATTFRLEDAAPVRISRAFNKEGQNRLDSLYLKTLNVGGP